MKQVKTIIVLFLFLVSSIAWGQDLPRFDQPPPITDTAGLLITPDPAGLDQVEIPHTEIYYALSTAVANVNALPDDISKDSQGVSIVPDETATQLMGWSKWLFSGTSANELLGTTLAPIGITLYVLLGMLVALGIAWTAVKIAMIIFKFIMTIVGLILKIVPFFG